MRGREPGAALPRSSRGAARCARSPSHNGPHSRARVRRSPWQIARRVGYAAFGILNGTEVRHTSQRPGPSSARARAPRVPRVTLRSAAETCGCPVPTPTAQTRPLTRPGRPLITRPRHSAFDLPPAGQPKLCCRGGGGRRRRPLQAAGALLQPGRLAGAHAQPQARLPDAVRAPRARRARFAAALQPRGRQSPGAAACTRRAQQQGPRAPGCRCVSSWHVTRAASWVLARPA